MTLSEQHKPILKKALSKINEIETIKKMFSTADPAYVATECERLEREYLDIISKLNK